MKANLIKAFDPDTYSKKSLIEGRENLIKDKLNVGGMILAFVIPIFIFHPIIKPRLKAIRRDMILQYYVQAGVVSRQLKTPLQKISTQEM